MKIVTNQHKDFLKNIDSNGYILPKRVNEDIKYVDSLDKDMWTSVYSWLDKEYEKRIGLPLDRDTIWVFYDTNFPYGTDFIGSEDFRLFIFEVPMKYIKSNFLWTGYFEWHNQLYIIDEEKREYGNLFDIDIKKPYYYYGNKRYPEIVQGITTRLNISWLKDVINIKGGKN